MSRYYNKSSYLRRKEIWYFLLFVFALFGLVVVSQISKSLFANTEQGRLAWLIAILIGFFLCYYLAKYFEHKTDKYSAGIFAENQIKKELLKLDHRFTVFHSVTFKGVGDIDFVVVGPTGVFAVEVKSRRGRFTSSNPWVFRFLHQAKWQASSLSRLIEQHLGKKVWVESILVFTRASVQTDFRQVNGVHVLRKSELAGFIQYYQDFQFPIEPERIIEMLKLS